MSCHTEVYKFIRNLSLNEQEFIIAEEIEFLSEHPYLGDSEYTIEEIWEILYSTNELDIIQEKLPNMYWEGVQSIIDNMIPTKNSYGKLVGRKLYEHFDFDYPFRLYGYPTETFTDAEELIQFISKEPHCNNITYFKNNELCKEVDDFLKKRIRNYFEENPNILISFG